MALFLDDCVDHLFFQGLELKSIVTLDAQGASDQNPVLAVLMLNKAFNQKIR